MKTALLSAALAVVSAAAAANDPFGVYAVVSADVPGARKATLLWQGGAVETVFLDPAPLLTASAIAAADTETGPGGEPQIRLVLTPEGARTLAELTQRHAGGRVGIVVDGRLRAAPFVTGGMAKDLVVGGAFTPAEASALAKMLAPPVASLPERAAGGPGRPVAGAPPGAAPDASTLRDLQGSWTVLSATRNSLVVPDAKLAGATWTFDGGTLTATDGTGTTTRFSLGTDAAAPGALRLDPVAPSREHGGWMLARREGERLVLAFFDGLAGRPESFAPEPKKVLLVLSRPGGAASPSPCDILAKAGVASLLPGAVREPERERRGGGPACALADAAGREVVLLLIPGAERAVFEAEAEKLRKKAPRDVRDEPQLGPTAVSSRKGFRALYLFLEKGTLVFLVFQIPGPEPDRFREFARRVRAEVRG